MEVTGVAEESGLVEVSGLLRKGNYMSVCKLVAPQDGGLSLAPMEGLLRGLRSPKDVLSLEISGVDGVVSYTVRTNNGRTLMGMLQSWFPQVRVERRDVLMGGWAELERKEKELDRKDWLHLGEDENAVVTSLGLSKASYLPLRVVEDEMIRDSGRDPLAGLIGQLASITRGAQGVKGDRLGVRLVIKPADENWNHAWQGRMQARRDGDDRVKKGGGSSDDSGPSMTSMAIIGGIVGLVGANWWAYDTLGLLGVVPLNVGAAASLVGGALLLKKLGGGGHRQYLDELLVEAKLKSLAYWAELQLVRVYPSSMADYGGAVQSLEKLVDSLRAFDDPAGNAWREGKVRVVTGQEVAGGMRDHPFLGGKQVLGWLDPRRAGRTALSAREVASLWHLPLGVDEMAAMERSAAAVLVPHLAELSEETQDAGPLVGISGGRNVWLPESAIRKHGLILGRSGVGKSTLMKHVIYHKLVRKSKGLDTDAIVIIDPHADLVRDILRIIPENIIDKVRLLDFGRDDRVPGVNLLDPRLFPGRDRCVDTIIETVKHLWEHWGGRLEDLLKRSLTAIYEFNEHAETSRDEMLTMLDILPLLDGGITTGSGPNAKTEKSPFQKHVLSRVKDAQIKQWFDGYMGWDRATRSEAVGPVYSRVGAYAANERSKVIMGQRESTIMLSDVLKEGLVLLVSTAQGKIGRGPAALMGGTMVSLVDSALRDQESIPYKDRTRCLIVCDEFQTVTGADWEGLLAEGRKYGCVLMLATQSVARLDTPERKLKAGLLGNTGVIVAYQMSAEDARIIAPEMDIERVQERDLGNLDPHHCIVRINSERRCYPAFTLETLPPPEDEHGSDAAVAAVLKASEAYTVDFEEMKEKMNKELIERLEGEKIGGDSGEGEGKKSLFSEAMDATMRQREEKGSLRNIKTQDIEDSALSKELLETLSTVPSSDPGLKAVIHKRVGDQIVAERRKVHVEETGKIEEAAKKKAESALAGEWAKLQEAQAKLGETVESEKARVEEEVRREARSGVAAEIVGERKGPKSLEKLRRVGA